MKKITIITALLAVLMLLVSCGGNEPSNPAGGDGGPDPLAGRTFSRWVSDETWAFGTDGTVHYTNESAATPIDITYNYTIDTAKKWLTLRERDASGNSTGKKILKEYSLSGSSETFVSFVLYEMIPNDVSLKTLAEEYWCPEFYSEGNYSSPKRIRLFINDNIVWYQNSSYFTDPLDSDECRYNITSISSTTIEATREYSEDDFANFPETLSISYTASGTGEDYTLSITADSNNYQLEWYQHFTNFEEGTLD